MKSLNYYVKLLNIYLDQQKGNYIESEQAIIQYKPDTDNDTFYNIATWVWLLQKQVSYQSTKELEKIDYKPLIAYLESEWVNPQPRIWNNEDNDIYLSNLSMAYAALLETKNSRRYNSVQKVMTEMRDFIFEHLLSKGTVLNGINERRIAIDELLAVIPYGLFSPEDLVIVEAVQKMVVQLDSRGGVLPFVGAHESSPAASAMLALYYLEKSDFENALYHEKIARASYETEYDELRKVILDIFDFFLLETNDNKNRIIHDPYGNDNVYISQLTERKPHYPTLSEHLRLACQVVSEKRVESVSVKIQNESKTWCHEEYLVPTLKNNTLIYEKKLEPLPNHERYYYYFVSTLKNGEKMKSQEFEVSTLKEHKANHFKLIKQTDDQLLLMFGENDNNHGLSVTFRENRLNITLQKELTKEVHGLTEEDSISCQFGEYTFIIKHNPCIIELYKGDCKVIGTHPLFAPIEWNVDIEGQVKEFKIHWYSPTDEEFYGFGERYNSMEQRGNVIDCYVYNQYRDQGTRTYMPMPFYLTNSGYGLFIDTKAYTKFDIASELKDKCSIAIEQVPHISNTTLNIYLGEYAELIKSFVHDTGKPKMIPAWALGPWMSSNNWDRQTLVEKEVETTNKYKIPATVLVLEQWSDETTYYMFNDAEYELKKPGEIHSYDEMRFPEWGRWPDPKGMVKYLHDNNLKLILWQIPIQKYLNKQQHPLKDQDEKFMIEKGYVVKNEDGSPYRIPENWFTNSLLMDFSNEQGCQWWFKKRQYLIDIGVDGFKTDGGEFVFGKHLKFANGQTGSEMRNQYPNDYVSAYYDFAQQNNGITFSRAGYTGAQNYPAHWAGDERSTFDAFKRSLIAGLNAGLSGVVFWGWDLAGFNGDIPTAELYMRSSAMAAFCPIMQYHAESKAEFNQDRTPWNIAERTGQQQVIDVYRFYANVRMNLIPYIYSEAKKASDTGLPIMRALMIDYPNDERVQGLYDEYLFGESLLIAPIINEGEVSRSIYLPEGKWFSFWTEEVFNGAQFIKVNANVDEIPVFVKANQALILNVDDSEKLGSSVGNDITIYQKPLCKIYFESDFKTTINDHLGNKVYLSIGELEEEIVVKVESDIDDLSFQVFGKRKPIRIEKL